MNTSLTRASIDDVGADAQRDPVQQMAGLMARLLEDPESESVLLPELLRLTETIPQGPTRGAMESSVVAMARLRAWLQQLQSRQRLTTRFNEVTSRLSRLEGLPALMQGLADEARQMVDAPLSRLDVFPPLVMAAGDAGLWASSGQFISRFAQDELPRGQGLFAQVLQSATPISLADGLSEAQRGESAAVEAMLRGEGLNGLVVLPLLMEGQCCGLLTIGDRIIRQWSAMDLESLQQLAAVAVRAIGRAARADMAQHTLQALHERQRVMRLQIERGGASSWPAAGSSDSLSEEPGSLALLLEGVPLPLREAYVEGVIGPLRRADQTRGTALVRTLLTYLDQGHNARAAARVLGVHVNTLHNRLETIATLLPGWEDSGRIVEVHLALRLVR